MKVLSLVGVMLLGLLMIAADWRDLKRAKRGRWIYAALLAAGFLIAGLLILAPGIPGPTEWLAPWFGPLGRTLRP